MSNLSNSQFGEVVMEDQINTPEELINNEN